MNTKTLHFSNGETWDASCIQILPDYSTERANMVRAHFAPSKDADHVVTVFGYCDRGTHRTCRAAMNEVRQFHPNLRGMPVYGPSGRKLGNL